MLHFLVWAILAALKPKVLLVTEKPVLAAVTGAAAQAPADASALIGAIRFLL